MRVISIGEGSLLTALYEGMFEQPLWQGFLSALMAQTGGTHASLLFRPASNEEVVELSVGTDLSGQIRSLVARSQDAQQFSGQEMREGRVYALNELLERIDTAQDTLSADAIAAARIKDVRSTRIAEPSGVSAWLTIASSRSFNAADAALLVNLVPHVRIALRSFIALEREKFHSSVASTAFGRLNFGWLTLDSQCHILDATPNMEQLFQRTGILRRGRYNRLMPASPAVDREISELVKQIAQGTHPQPKAINLSRDPWMDMLVTPAQKPAIAGHTMPIAIAYVSGDRQSQADRCDQLVDLFGILPSEARLAWQLAQGTSIAQAAKAIGLTEETARNYSKKIYAKTGARGQPELVRIIMTSVLAIA